MKLSDYKKDYYQLSGLASNASRQLAFAGIALIWVFKSQSENGFQLPSELLIPSMCLIFSLGFDLLQYVTGSITWGLFHRYHEKKRTSEIDPELEAPFYYTWPINFFFYCKIISVLVSYSYLALYSINSIWFK